jgi:hypothetical protein
VGLHFGDFECVQGRSVAEKLGDRVPDVPLGIFSQRLGLESQAPSGGRLARKGLPRSQQKGPRKGPFPYRLQIR